MGLKNPVFSILLLGLEENFGKPQIPPKKHGTHALKEVQENA